MERVGLIVPACIFGTILVAILIAIPYSIFLEQKVKIEEQNKTIDQLTIQAKSLMSSLEDARKQIPPSIIEILASPYLKDRDIPITSLGMVNPVIKNKVFDNCRIIGPAVMTIAHTEIRGCGASGTPDTNFVVVPNEAMEGILLLEGCRILNCTFVNVSFVGNGELIAKLREGFGVR